MHSEARVPGAQQSASVRQRSSVASAGVSKPIARASSVTAPVAASTMNTSEVGAPNGPAPMPPETPAPLPEKCAPSVCTNTTACSAREPQLKRLPAERSKLRQQARAVSGHGVTAVAACAHESFRDLTLWDTQDHSARSREATAPGRPPPGRPPTGSPPPPGPTRRPLGASGNASRIDPRRRGRCVHRDLMLMTRASLAHVISFGRTG